jgi:hemoglobin/transferrin/lactoferrin receptor protein
MRLLDDRLSLIPGVRVDYYKLDPRNDPIYAGANPFPAKGLNDTSWSPKLGAIWRFSDVFSAYAQYSHAFRAPPYADVNLGFTNLQFGYTSLPNPDLKPETSNGFELGLRASGRLGYFSVSAYENRYHDFIESTAFVGFDPDSGLIEFQSINLSKVKIRGVEARYGLELGEIAPALKGWTIKGSLATSRGDDETAHAPLASVQPARAVIGLAYDRENWGAELIGSFVERKDRVPQPVQDDPSVPVTPLFEAPGYATLDAYAHWHVQTHVDLFAGITNITDRKYFDWGVVGGLPVSSTIDRYSAPGRAIRGGVRVSF